MNQYDNNLYLYNPEEREYRQHTDRQTRYDRRPPQRKRPRRKRRSAGRTIVTIVMAVAVTASCLFSIAAFHQSKLAQSNAAPYATATSQTFNAGTEYGYWTTNVSGVAAQAMPSVVSITSRTTVMNYGYSDIYDYFRQFGYGPNQAIQDQAEEVESGIGSGTIVGMNENELLILTSYHVVSGSSSLYVTFTDETSVDGYIKSAAEEKDIAVVAVPLSDIPEETMQNISVAKLCTDGVQVGEGIIIIGNALGYGQSVITGVISAKDREVEGVEGTSQRLLQTDAAINPGNSGGCMLNIKGEIVGISEAKLVDSSVEGMCYAIPIQENLELIEQLLNTEGSMV